MVSADIVHRLKLDLANMPGWHTRRKLIVFESDDWGSIRMPSRDTYERLLKNGIPVNKSHYYKFDCLESEADYQELFSVLTSVKDKWGKHPVFTNNFVAANPDFKKIEGQGFREYFYEDIAQTYKRYPNHKDNFEIIGQGLSYGIMLPQSHGREHLNVMHWMSALQRKERLAMFAFQNDMFTLPRYNGNQIINTFVDALYFHNDFEKEAISTIVAEGLKLFEKQWGFISRSFIAPGYIWDSRVEDILRSNGVKYLQGAIIQLRPTEKVGKRFSKKYHFTGQMNKNKQTYIIRNAFFEPSEDLQRDWVSSCLRDISNAFLLNKPAVIQSHRVNYMGSIFRSNRDNSLKNLARLLKEVTTKWPEVEFMSSVQLGDLMKPPGY